MFWPILISSLAWWSVALAGGFYYARRYVRAIELRAAAGDHVAQLQRRVEALELAMTRDIRSLDGATSQPRIPGAEPSAAPTGPDGEP